MSSFLLHADLTLKIRTTANGRASESTEYYKGNLLRRDFATGYQVVDFSTGRSFSVDPEKKEYYPFDQSKIALKRVVDPSHKIFVETTWSATGEERQWFGYPAHRYLITKSSRAERNGQSIPNRETHLDIWVLDEFPVPPHVQGIAGPSANYFLTGGTAGGIMKVPEIKATHTGPVPHGLIVRSKSEQIESEIVALSLAPLDESLFEVPKSLRELKSPAAFHARPLSWSDQLALEWMRFRAWFDTLFEN